MTGRRRVFTLAAWAGLALLAVIAVVSQLTLRRNVQLWEIERAYQEVVYLEPGGSVSQRIETQIGDISGFAALVRPSDSRRLAYVNLRIRRSGGDREILRESVQRTNGPNHQVVTAIPLPPIPDDGPYLEYEMEVAAYSPGGLVVLGSEHLYDLPPNQLTINGADTLPDLRALVSPIASVSAWSLMRDTIGVDPIRSALYVLAIAVASAGGIALGALTLRHIRATVISPLPFIALVPVMMALILTAAAATFAEQFGEGLQSTLIATYWNTALAYAWLLDTALLMIWLAYRWVHNQGTRKVPLRKMLLPAVLWPPLLAATLTLLGLSIGFALLKMDDAGNVSGALAEISLGLALLLGMAASLRSEA